MVPEGRKVGSLKRRVRSHLARGEMNNCTPLWCEAHVEVKTYKTHQHRSTFGRWDVKKAHAVVARSTFRGQCTKHFSVEALLEVELWKKCALHAIVVQNTFRNQHVQSTQSSDYLWMFNRATLYTLQQNTTTTTATTTTTIATATATSNTLQLQLQLQLPLHCKSNYNYNYHYTTVHCSTLQYTTVQYSAL